MDMDIRYNIVTRILQYGIFFKEQIGNALTQNEPCKQSGGNS